MSTLQDCLQTLSEVSFETVTPTNVYTRFGYSSADAMALDSEKPWTTLL